MKTSDLLDKTIAYENGQMNDEEIAAFFQYLIDTGLASQLQGHYGRTARSLIAAGQCRSRSSVFSLN